MSFAGFPNFDACLIHMKEKQGYSEEIAKKVCGKLQAESENGLLEDVDFKLASELQCRIPDLPKEAFAYSDDMGGHLPHHGMDGKIKCNCVRAAIQAMGGARTGKPMNVPESARTHLMTHAKECGIDVSENAATKSHIGKEAAILAFAQKPVEFTDMPNGDVVFHNVTLLAEGKWTDKHSRKSIKYSGNELIRGIWEKRTFKAQHDIYDELPVTNEIGAIENEKFVTTPTPRWIGDVRVFPTQLGKDISTLLKRKQIKGISTEVLHVLVPDAAGELQSTEEIFMGAATVREGACLLCTFNEGENIMEQPTGSGGADPAISALEKQLQDAVTNKSSDVAALTAQLEEVRKSKNQAAFAELDSMRKKVAELESVNAELVKKFAQQEHDGRVRDLQRQIAELSKQPAIYTQITGSGSGSRAKTAELDSGSYPAMSVQEFGD